MTESIFARFCRVSHLLLRRVSWSAEQPLVAVLAYHAFDAPFLALSRETFAQQMRYLREHGMPVIRLEDIGAALAGQLPEAPLYAVITFDDCFRSAMDIALPVLIEYQMSATFFLTVDYEEKTLWGDPVAGRWFDTQKVGRHPFSMYRKSDIARLVESGMTIGSHGMTHANLDEIGEQEAWHEVSESRAILQERSGQPVNSFCYPRGRYSQSTVGLVKKAGYHFATTTRQALCQPSDDRCQIPRLYAMTTGFRFGMEVRGLYAEPSPKQPGDSDA